MATTTSVSPNNLGELINMVKEAANSFGYAEGKNGYFRDCISDNKGEPRTPKIKKDAKVESVEEANYWFGYIREDQPTSGAYEGLSFVIFPEPDPRTKLPKVTETEERVPAEDTVKKEQPDAVTDTKEKSKRCLVSIGIGSSSMGRDGDLAASPGFRRSFMRLTKKGSANAKFFFKLRFDDMETSTPGLQEELYNEESDYDEVLTNTATKYNADETKDAPGLLPAAFIVDYNTNDGWKLIKAWLAQYAKWRGWHTTDLRKKSAKDIIKDSIEACKEEPKCPDAADVKDILAKHKFVVLQGAPGCGKTWTANEVANTYFNESKGEKPEDYVMFTQFHAETTYSDFVYGIRPTLKEDNVTYKGVKGTLLKAIDIAEKAAKEKKDVLLIIDEINRANLANVLGPVFYLFEPNASRKHEIELGTIYDKDKGEEIVIKKMELPENLHVLATMNTADKSLAVVDFALRRRFKWVNLRPHKLTTHNFDAKFYDKVDELFMKYATDEELNLQPGQQYFMDTANRKETIKYGLIPLFKEYFAEGFLLPAKEEIAQLLSTESGEFMYE